MGNDLISNMLRLLRTPAGPNVPHENFQISPSDTDELRFLAGCQLEAVFGWVLELLLHSANVRRADESTDIITSFR